MSAGRLPYYVNAPQVVRLPTILAGVADNSLRIPRFQRDFVWKPLEKERLFDSIAKGFPIGTFLIWRTGTTEIATRDRVGSLVVSDSKRGSRPTAVDFLIDGQQRLTTLFTAMMPPLPPAIDEQWSLEALAQAVYGDAASARSWAIFFDPLENKFVHMPRRGPLPPYAIPLFLILRNVPLMRFLGARAKEHEQYLTEEQRQGIETLSSSFKDYMIPTIPVVTDDIETAIESFQRVNRPTTPLTQFDVAHAMGFSRNLDLASWIEQLRLVAAEEGWNDLPEKTIGKAIKLAVELDVYDQSTKRLVDALVSAPELLEILKPLVTRTIQWMREQFGIYGLQVLPYEFQWVLILDVLRLANTSALPSLNAQAIVDWFWATTLSEHFTGLRQINRTRLTLLHMCRGGSIEHIVDNATVEPLGVFDWRRARYRGFLLWYAKKFLPSFLTPSSDVLASLGQNGVSTVQQLILPVRLQSHPKLVKVVGNFTLGDRSAVRRIVDRLAQPVQAVDAINDDEFRLICHSHAIDDTAMQLLKTKDYAGFVDYRHKFLQNQEAEWIQTLGLRYGTSADGEDLIDQDNAGDLDFQSAVELDDN